MVLGICVLMALKPPLWVAAVTVGAFAIFHGHAHGVELPDAANPLAYALGFVIATGLIQLCGIGLESLTAHTAGQYAVRAGGAGIAAFGLAYLTGFA